MVARQRPRPTLRQGWIRVRCQLTGNHCTENLKLSPSQNVGCMAEVVTQSGTSVHHSGLSCRNETGGLSATLVVNRLGRCRATRPCPLFGLPTGDHGTSNLKLSLSQKVGCTSGAQEKLEFFRVKKVVLTRCPCVYAGIRKTTYAR